MNIKQILENKNKEIVSLTTKLKENNIDIKTKQVLNSKNIKEDKPISLNTGRPTK